MPDTTQAPEANLGPWGVPKLDQGDVCGGFSRCWFCQEMSGVSKAIVLVLLLYSSYCSCSMLATVSSSPVIYLIHERSDVFLDHCAVHAQRYHTRT